MTDIPPDHTEDDTATTSPSDDGSTIAPPPSDYRGQARPATRRFVALLACRLLAMWVWLSALLMIGYPLSTLIQYISASTSSASSSGAVEFSTVLVAVVPSAILAFFGALLWVIGPSVAGRIADARTEPELPISMPAVLEPEMPHLSAVFCAIGALVLATALPELARQVVQPLLSHHNDLNESLRDATWQGGFCADVLRVALGFWLLLGSRGLANWVRSMRQRGGAPSSATDVGSDAPL